ncbi:Adenosine deaminase [Enterobacter cloacae]|uniref:Adenosine deaminase n=1 Tax=Enterobacter cloacae TaxID=550 RepID=A0A377M2K7_ENTCL|nr:Adenosine deaminase [Enterobacter cloacae]
MIDTRLPLTDIHRHLDGNIRAQTILDLGRQYNLTLPAQSLETLIRTFRSPLMNRIWSVF